MITDASCIFSTSSLCTTGDSGSAQIDTGLIDSHKHLGINARSKNRVSFRKVVTCAPVNYDGYVSEVPDNTTNGYDFIQYNLGPVGDITTGIVSNYTISYSSHTPNDHIGYTVFSVYATAGASNPPYIPITPLNRTDADESFHYIASNTVEYLTPVYDLVFSANGTYRDNDTFTIPGGLYEPDQFLNIIGCTDQMQFCNPNTGDCTPLAGQVAVVSAVYDIGLNLYQQATAERIYLAALKSSTYLSVDGLRGGALLAQDKLYNFISPGLPANQWILEIQLWVQTSLAKLQQLIVDFPIQSENLGTGGYILAATDWNADDTREASLAVLKPAHKGRAWLSVFLSFLDLSSSSPSVHSSSYYLLFSNGAFSKLPNRKPGKGKRHKYVASIADHKLSLLGMLYSATGNGHWQKGSSGRPVLSSSGLLLPGPAEDGTGLLHVPNDNSKEPEQANDAGVRSRLLPRRSDTTLHDHIELGNRGGSHNVPDGAH